MRSIFILVKLVEQTESQRTEKGLFPQGGLINHKIHFTLKYVQVVKKESDLVTLLLKTFQKLSHCLRQYLSTLAAHWNYLGKCQKCQCPGPSPDQLSQNVWGWNSGSTLEVSESC